VGLGQVGQGGPWALAEGAAQEEGLLGLDHLVGPAPRLRLALEVVHEVGEALGDVAELGEVEPREGEDHQGHRQAHPQESGPGDAGEDEEEDGQPGEEGGRGEVGFHQDEAHQGAHRQDRPQDRVVLPPPPHEGGEVEDQGQLGELRGLEGHGAQVEPAAHPPGPVPHEEDQDEEEEDAHQGVEGVAEEEAGRKEVAEDQGQEGGPHPEEVILEEAGLRRAHADEAEGEEEEGA